MYFNSPVFRGDTLVIPVDLSEMISLDINGDPILDGNGDVVMIPSTIDITNWLYTFTIREDGDTPPVVSHVHTVSASDNITKKFNIVISSDEMEFEAGKYFYDLEQRQPGLSGESDTVVTVLPDSSERKTDKIIVVDDSTKIHEA